MWHESVLLEEVITGLSVQEGDVVVDATVGDGGYLAHFCQGHGASVTFIGIDADREQIARARRRLKETCPNGNFQFIERNFRHIASAVREAGYQTADRILFDLGWSAYQVGESGRGFSFRRDEPLEMTYAGRSSESAVTAYDVVNTWDEDVLHAVLKGYGEERFARRIAQAIIERREREPLLRTSDLADVVLEATPSWYHHRRLHPATRTFQAIRMAVNDEIRALEDGLDGAIELLATGGRIAVITFHSLEDRIVKRRFREWQRGGVGTVVTKKPIIASRDELEENPRSRSAKLRIFEK